MTRKCSLICQKILTIKVQNLCVVMGAEGKGGRENRRVVITWLLLFWDDLSVNL